MQPLLDKLDDRQRQDVTQDVSGAEGEFEEEAMAETEELKAILNEQLGSLPEEAKRKVAAHLTPEFAQLVGAITGSPALANVLGEMADPNLALVPMPRKMAQQIVDQMQAQQPASPEAAPSPEPAPAGPSGVMGAM